MMSTQKLPSKLAVVVGISTHEKPHLNLRSPENDARDLAAILTEDHDYELILYCGEEATHDRLQALFQQEIAARVHADTRLVVYFAGHGLVIDSLSQPKGYLVPYDGDDDESTLLPMETVYAGLEELPCKHVLVILDCCFAGAFRWGQYRDSLPVRAPELYRERYDLFLRRPAWQLITSAAADEKAADVLAGMAYGVRRESGSNSPFLTALIRGLRGAADIQPPGGDGVVTATELYLFLRQEIERMDDYAQTPGLWTLARHEQGEFVFHVPRREPALPSAPELARENCPYRGLEPYSEADRELLFGRSRVLEQLIARVEAEALTVVVAPSGAGKSSVVRAGLIPRYRDAHPGASIDVTRPSQRDDNTIASAIAQANGSGSCLLVIDQLEELLALERTAGSRDAYLTAITQALDSGVRIVATLRSDFEAQFASHLLRDRWPKARFALVDMTREELREAIEGPATRAVLFFEPPALVDRLVDAVVGTPGVLPLLSVLLSRMYEQLVVRADGERLLLESDYEALGGIAGALRERLETLHDQLDAPTQAILRSVLMRLIEIDGGAVARRPVREQELDFGDPVHDAGVKRVWDLLTAQEARLATASADDRNRKLELVHDAVIRSWSKFDEWIRDRDAVEDLRLERRIAGAEQEWSEKHDARLLWHADPRLDLAMQLGKKPLGLNRREREFIATSTRKRRRGKLIAGLAIAVVLGVVGSLILVAVLKDQAEKRRAIGEDGAKAQLLAGVSGKENEALMLGIRAVDRALQMNEAVPPGAMDGLVAAIAATGQLLFYDARHHGENNQVWRVSCTSDGNRVLSVSMDAAVVSAPNGEDERQIGEGGFAVAFAGTSILTGSDEVELRSSTGEVQASKPAGQTVWSVSASEDGHRVIAILDDGKAFLWSPASAAAPITRNAHSDKGGLATAMTHDGRLVATSGWDERVRIWTIDEDAGADAELNPKCDVHPGLSALALNFSPDGGLLALAGHPGFQVIDTKTCAVKVDKTVSEDPDTFRDRPSMSMTRGVAFTSDGADIVSVGGDGIIRRWDGVSGRNLGIIARTNRKLSSVATCGPGRLVIGDETGGVSVWQMTPDPSFMRVRTGSTPTALAFAPGAKTLAIAADTVEGAVTLVELSSGEQRQLDASPLRPWLVGFSRDGAQLLAVGRNSQLQRWNSTTLRDDTVQNMDLIGRPFLSRDGTLLGAMKSDGLLHLWKDFEEVKTLDVLIDPLIPGAASDDGGRVATFDRTSGHIRVWETTRFEQVGEFAFDGSGAVTTTLSLSPDGQHLLFGGSDGIVRVGDVDRGEMVLELLAHTREIWASAFAPDGRTFATGGADGLVMVWDRETGTRIATLPGSLGLVFALTFSDDGETIAVASFDGATRLYTIDPKRLLEMACDRLGQSTDDFADPICTRDSPSTTGCSP